MNQLIQTLLNGASEANDSKGNSVYKIGVQPFLDAGYSFKDLRSQAKKMGIRFIQNDSKIAVQSKSLQADLEILLTKMAA